MLRYLAYPATSMLAIAAAFVFLRVSPGARLQTFAMLAMTIVGATEVVMAIIGLVTSESRRAVVSRALNGSGALLVAYALLRDMRPAPFVMGSLVLSAGLLLWQRELRTAGE